MTARSSFALALALGVTACTGGIDATRPGKIGGFDGSHLLPEGVLAPPVREREVFTATRTVCDDDTNLAPATVKITWHGFNVGKDQYVSDYQVELLEIGEHLQISLDTDAATLVGAGLEPDAPWMGVAEVHLQCKRQIRGLVGSIDYQDIAYLQLRADGKIS